MAQLGPIEVDIRPRFRIGNALINELRRRILPWPPEGCQFFVMPLEEDVLMGNKLKVNVRFGALPAGYETEIKHRKFDVIVNEVTDTKIIPTTEAGFSFLVDQGDHIRIEGKYVDDAGNESKHSVRVVDFIASDTTQPPDMQTDGAISIEVVEEVEAQQPAPAPTDPPQVDPPTDTPVATDPPVVDPPAEPTQPSEPAPTDPALTEPVSGDSQPGTEG